MLVCNRSCKQKQAFKNSFKEKIAIVGCSGSGKSALDKMIHKDYSFASIGRNLDRSASTIAREVLHYRCFTSRIPLMGENDCINRFSCQRNTLCPEVGVHGCFAAIVK